MEASYRVKIEGRLLEDDNEETDETKTQEAATEEANESEESAQKSKSPEKPRFSHFLKSLTVDFDRSRYRTGSEQTVEWKKPDAPARSQPATNLPAAADFDELTFKRSGDENQNITINLFRQESPERYQLSPELADVVDMKDATHQEAVMGLWEYIKLLGLQEDEEKRNFRCNEPLKKVCHAPYTQSLHVLTFEFRLYDRVTSGISLCSTTMFNSTFGRSSPFACRTPSESIRNSTRTLSPPSTTSKSQWMILFVIHFCLCLTTRNTSRCSRK